MYIEYITKYCLKCIIWKKTRYKFIFKLKKKKKKKIIFIYIFTNSNIRKNFGIYKNFWLVITPWTILSAHTLAGRKLTESGLNNKQKIKQILRKY
jgi:hypothetical protein